MSTVVLDTITGKSTATTITIGSTPVVSASANSMTIRGEGSAQTSIQQGLCKQWANWDGATTVADSFNTTSATDNASGDSTMTIATAMVSINFTVGGLSKSNDNGGVRLAAMQFPANATAIPSTTTYRIHTQYENATLRDAELQTVHIFGDLA
mgnify:FL=1